MVNGILGVRVHPQLASTFKEYKNESSGDRIIDESADEAYEILGWFRCFYTDYS